jgi:hypothetical protein
MSGEAIGPRSISSRNIIAAIRTVAGQKGGKQTF